MQPKFYNVKSEVCYRYNMHVMPKTMLIEAGAQTNTVEEMMNAMEVLSEILVSVVK